MKLSFKTLCIAGIATVAIVVACLVLLRPRHQAQASIAARGGRSTARFDIGTGPIHLQKDPRWRDQQIGGSGESIGAVGCAVCSISMALANYGIAIPPDSLNAQLKAHTGYTDRGWLRWEMVSEITGGKAGIDIPDALDHATIDNALAARTPVIAKVMIRGSISHWVLIVGKEGDEYLIRDPLGNGRDLVPFSSYNSDIYAIRLVRPAA